jgi:hypothetical protein
MRNGKRRGKMLKGVMLRGKEKRLEGGKNGVLEKEIKH